MRNAESTQSRGLLQATPPRPVQDVMLLYQARVMTDRQAHEVSCCAVLVLAQQTYAGHLCLYPDAVAEWE